MGKHRAEKDRELEQATKENQQEVNEKQKELGELLDTLNKFKEEKSDLERILNNSKEYARQLKQDIRRHKVTKVESDLTLSENLSDPRNYIEAVQEFTLREVQWVVAQIGSILESRRNESYYSPTYTQYKT